MPPQHGKSTFSSGIFPAYFLGRNPDACVSLVSYAADFAEQWGGEVKNLFETVAPQYWGLTTCKRRKRTNGWWHIDGHRGGMRCVGVDGSLTGFPTDLAIIDDPIKNAKEAFSPARRKACIDFYHSCLETRRSATAAVILVMTRWHVDDLAGYLLEKQKGQWEVLSMPALAWDPKELPKSIKETYRGDPLGRAPGEALCPQLKPKWYLEEYRQGATKYFFDSMFQQVPTPLGGGIFKESWFANRWVESQLPVKFDPQKNRWEYRNKRKVFDDIIQVWDFPFDLNETGSFAVGQVWARWNGRFFLLDQFRKRIGIPGMIAAVAQMTKKWPMTRAKLLECKAAGPKVIKALKGKIPGIIPIDPTGKGSKEVRALVHTHYLEGGDCVFPAHADWWEEFLVEFLQFPNGSTDDQVDNWSAAMERLSQKVLTTIRTGKTKKVTNFKDVKF